MSDRDALDRFKFNLTMAFGLFWIALTGGCSAWYLFHPLAAWLYNGGRDGLADVAFIAGVALLVGAIALIPGMLAWHWGKLRSGYDPSRDLTNPMWKIPQAIGVSFAIGSWFTGTTQILQMMSYGALSGSLTLAALSWLPGWLLYWASTRPYVQRNQTQHE